MVTTLNGKIVIEGGRSLQGEVEISGAKNAVLPCIAASILVAGKCKLKNIPQLKDTDTMLQLLTQLGAEVTIENKDLIIDTSNIKNYKASYDLVKTMRASILVMGPLLGRFKKACVSLPGGCAIGLRPVDLHLKGLKALTCKINLDAGYIHLSADNKLRGRDIYLDFPSVGATENIMTAAVLAEGETTIYGAAKEPEIVNLAEFLKKLGAQIEGAGTDRIHIIGIKESQIKQNFEHEIIPDRIEAGTYMIAAAITEGKIKIKNVIPSHLNAIITKLEEAGVKITISNDNSNIYVEGTDRLSAVNIKTMPYPGFPTDMQAQFMGLMTQSLGISVITENIFEQRFMHAPELIRLGADIKINKNVAVVRGKSRLIGTSVMATDLRASAALVLAGLAACGTTQVHRVYHLDRGYERLEEKLQNLGANIKRIK